MRSGWEEKQPAFEKNTMLRKTLVLHSTKQQAEYRVKCIDATVPCRRTERQTEREGRNVACAFDK